MKRLLEAGIVETYTVVRVALDRRAPNRLRLLIVAVLVSGYVLSPIDVVSDLVPVVGLGDDLLVGLLGRKLIYRETPEALREHHREVARSHLALVGAVIGLFVLVVVVIVARSFGVV